MCIRSPSSGHSPPGARSLSRPRYGVEAGGGVVVHAQPELDQWPCSVRPPALLPQLLPAWSLQRAVLLSNGRLEYVLATGSG